MDRWDIDVNGTKHEIVFEGCGLSGKAKLRVDGNQGVYAPLLVKKLGLFYPFQIEDSEIILKLDLKKQPVGLIQDGVDLDTGLPMEEEAASALLSFVQTSDPLTAKDKAGMGSFLTFVVLSYVNLLLILVDATVSFPFSAFVPQFIAGVAFFGYQEDGDLPFLIAGVAIAVLFASVYLVLYFLAKKRLWPIVVALVFIALDTLVVLFFAVDDVAASIIDILFHGWVLWSLFKLMNDRRKRAKEVSCP